MNHRRLYILALILGSFFLMVGCQLGGATEETPDEVTEAFYTWYINSVDEPGSSEMRNPLRTGSYRSSPYLTADFIKQLDDTVAQSDQRFDPILQAQDIPARIEVQESTINDMEATTVVLCYWRGNPHPSPLTAHLVQENGRWLINNVTAFEIPVMNPPVEPETAVSVVRAFYEWYLGYLGDPATDNFRNPLVDRAYHDTPYLTGSFVQHIDELLDYFDSEYGGAGYDPFLCAQAIPTFIKPDVSFERNGMTAVVVRSSFPNQMFTVDLLPEGESWRISNITCAHDPAGTAKTFYTWYLGYIGDRSTGDFHNPLMDKAYRDHPLLTDSFEQSVDEALAGFENGGFDPFLLAHVTHRSLYPARFQRRSRSGGGNGRYPPAI